ncbi:MAG: hypothetical protein J0M34_00685 [Alphaproteobacteria bacterium]|nr:hypothetical protein [Alphaproteobacteria bacterium]
MADMSHFIVPAWYSEAKSLGENETQLKARIRTFCEEADKRRVNKVHAPTVISDSVIDLTFQMYEQALTMGTEV